MENQIQCSVSPWSSNRLYIGQIPSDLLDSSKLYQHFSQYGKIEDLDIRQLPMETEDAFGFMYITFTSEKIMQKVYQDIVKNTFFGHHVKVHPAFERGRLVNDPSRPKYKNMLQPQRSRRHRLHQSSEDESDSDSDSDD